MAHDQLSPRPWKILAEFDKDRNVKSIDVMDARDVYVAMIYDGPAHRLVEDTANAYLICAAPDLLEAAKVARNLLRMDLGIQADRDATIEQLELAIGKATDLEGYKKAMAAIGEAVP